MKRAVVLGACGALVLGLAGCAEGVFVSRPGFVLDSQPRLGEGDFLNPGVALIISAEGGREVGAQVEPVVRGLVGDEGSSGPIDLSGVINEQLAQAGLTEGDLTVTDLFLTLALVGGDPRVEFVDEPTRVRVSIDELWINGAATARASFDVASFACRLEGSIAENTPDRRMLTLRDIVVELELGEVDGRFDLQVTDLAFDLAETGIAVVDEEDDPFYYCDFPECQDGSDGSGGCSECHAVCGSVEIVSDAVNLFAANLEELLGGALEDLIRDRLQGFTRLSGEVHLASFLADTLPDLLDSHPVAFELRPSSRGFRTVSTQGGNDLVAWMDLGSRPQAVHPCVGEDLGQPSFLLGPAPTTDELGEPRAHLAVGLPTATVDQLLWSFYRSGGLCLQISSADISKLTGGGGIQFNSATVGLLLPGLSRIIGNDAPLLLSLQPQFDLNDPGLVQLGTGEGEGEDRDSLVRVLLPPLELGLYAWFEGRWVRLFAIEAAVDVGITPMFAASDKLDLSVDHILIYNLVEKYNELFPGVDLLQIFQAGIELGLGLLAGQGFELPIGLDALLQSSLGVPLSIELGEPKAAGLDRDWLLLGARLGSAARSYEGPLARVDVALLDPPATLAAGEPLRLRARALDVARLPREGVEYQARLDAGVWRGFVTGGELVLDSPLLKVPGVHTVEVRARVQGQWQTLDLSPARHEVTVLSFQAEAPAQEAPAVLGEAVSGEEGGSGEAAASGEGGSGEAGAGGCACASAPSRPAGGAWALVWGVALGLGWAWRRRAARAAALLALAGAACSDDKPKASGGDTSPPDCVDDADCAVHEAGLVCVNGACVGPAGCDGDEDCCADEVCVNGACGPEASCVDDEGCGLGLRCQEGRCQRAGCASDEECVRGQACLGGVCASPEAPLCPAPCAQGEACLAPLARCVPAPEACAGVSCADGEVLYVEDPGVVLGPVCSVEEASCACQAAAEPAVEGDPTGWLKARVAPDGRVAIAAYDLSKKDLTLRWLDAGAQEPGEVLHLDGLPEGAGPTPASDRSALGAGPDVGAELDLAIHPDGALGIVYVDRTRKVLRMAASPDGQNWSFLDLDADGQGGRWPDIEADPDGGWVVAYQGVAPQGAGEVQTSLRVAVSGLSDVTRPSEFQTVTLASASAAAPYPALPVGVGATPSLARGSDGTWFVASHDANAGTLELRWWSGSPQDAQALVWVEPQTRSGLPGGTTGVGPHLLAGEGGRLDVVYLDANAGELRHAGARFDGAGLAEPRAELIDVGLSALPSRQLAMDAALIRLRDGRMVVAWQDTTYADVFVAWTDTEGAVWSIEYSEGDGSEGYFPQLVEEPEGILLLHGEWIVDAPGHISQSLRLRRL